MWPSILALPSAPLHAPWPCFSPVTFVLQGRLYCAHAPRPLVLLSLLEVSPFPPVPVGRGPTRPSSACPAPPGDTQQPRHSGLPGSPLPCVLPAVLPLGPESALSHHGRPCFTSRSRFLSLLQNFAGFLPAFVFIVDLSPSPLFFHIISLYLTPSLSLLNRGVA